MINPKIGGLILAAFIAGAFIASPELRAYAANTVGSADIIDESILSQDIKNGEVKNSDIAPSAVTNSKIGNNAVTTGKIADGTIISADVSSSFMKFVQLIDDGVGHGVGWNPNGVLRIFTINDAAVTSQSNIIVTLSTPQGANDSNCGVDLIRKSQFRVYCDSAASPPDGSYINYMVVAKQHPLTQFASIVPGASSKTTGAFTPYPIIIKVGDTITWKNEDTTPHTVTSGSGPSDPNKGKDFDSSPGLSSVIAPGSTFSNKFTQAGTFLYFCQLHPNMVGEVGVNP